MKNFKIVAIVITLLFSKTIQGQLSFILSSTLCLGGTTTVSANTGTLAALQYSWGAIPAGPVFSSPTASSTTISFPVAGIYTIGIGILTSSGLVYVTNTIIIIALNSLSIATSATAVCPGFSATITAFGANTYTWTGSSFSTAITQQSISVGPGSYTVVGSNGGTCTQTLYPVNIFSLNPAIVLPITIALSSPTTCISSNFPKFSKPVQLNASGAGTYTWFPLLPPSVNPPPNNQIDVRPVSSTCYTVIGASAVCSNSAVSCVSVVPQFSINILPSSETMCVGDTIMLQVGNVGSLANGPSSSWTYFWTESSTSTISMSNYFTPTVTIFPQNSASYTLELRDSKECISLPEVATVTVNKCTGMAEVIGETQFRIFPNPSTSQIKIVATLFGNTTVFLSDLLGNKILETSLEMNGQSESSINISFISPGIYYLTLLSSNNQVFIHKILKQ